MLLSGNQNQFYINILPYFGYFNVLRSPFSQVDYGTILSMLDGRICNEYLEEFMKVSFDYHFSIMCMEIMHGITDM
jgi:hypothetical protein